MAGVAYYNVAGMRLGSHQIAMGWLGILVGGTYLALSGPKKTAAEKATPPINASSSDEADFIKKFMEEQEKKQ
ncbi:putative rho GDP dissociation inhibitor [Purpureocillium lavendulum]|uniref:Rho GDP dissociation inhibitor n=1 Tax=Purpureocillium lavendulum TaxID=1247861 RepID=A0AB34G891_9HYPO|nr:putative rho GDP dissociation inhibitor [Purpureocillium lavendulum]